MSFNIEAANPQLVYGSDIRINVGQVFLPGIQETELKNLESPNVIPANRMVMNFGENMLEVSQVASRGHGSAKISPLLDRHQTVPNGIDFFSITTTNLKATSGFLHGLSSDAPMEAMLQQTAGVNYNVLDAKLKLTKFHLDRADDYITLFGLPERDIYGFYNSPDFVTIFANSEGGNTQWNNKSTDAIIQDILNVKANMQADSGLTRSPTMMILPVSAYNGLGVKNSQAGDLTLQTFIETNYNMTIRKSSLLTDTAVFVDNTYSDDIKFVKPVSLASYTPEYRGQNQYLYDYYRQTCAMMVLRPYSTYYLEGVA